MRKDRGEDFRWNLDRPVAADDFNRYNPVAIFAGPLLTMYMTVTKEELKTLLDRGEDIVLVDIRESAEFGKEHICGAMNLPLRSIEEKASALLKKDDLLIVCGEGEATLESAVGADKLTTLLYENVLRYAGGVRQWADAGYCVEGTDTGLKAA